MDGVSAFDVEENEEQNQGVFTIAPRPQTAMSQRPQTATPHTDTTKATDPVRTKHYLFIASMHNK